MMTDHRYANGIVRDPKKEVIREFAEIDSSPACRPKMEVLWIRRYCLKTFYQIIPEFVSERT